MTKDKTNVAAIYCRLSRDDGTDSESNSVQNQRKMLRKYAKEQGFVVYKEYVDDGISGTTFNRPSFNEMILDIENKKIGIVLVKDMSRLGRHNALVAHYTEVYFPDNDIRFISVTEGIDTFDGDNEIMPFKSVINEYYARDISKKIRSARKILAYNGDFIASYAPYGYQKNPLNRHQLVIDEEVAPNVKRIFQMAAEGCGTHQIARALDNDGILTPRAYIAEKRSKYLRNFNHKFPTNWNSGTIKLILRNKAYMGHIVSSKSKTKSFKNHKLIQLPESEWIEVQNTHEPIIDKHLFELVQRMKKSRVQKRRKDISIFTGLLKCPDCGCSLYFVQRNPKHCGGYYCGKYRKNTRHCPSHYIAHDSLYELVLKDIKHHIKLAKINEGELARLVEYLSTESIRDKTAHLSKKLVKLEKRKGELGFIIDKLIEQSLSSVISDERRENMIKGYEEEQQLVDKQIEKTTVQLEDEKAKLNAKKFLKIAKKYVNMKSLDRVILNELIDSIYVHDSTGNPKKDRKQRVEINYKFY